MKRVFSAIMSLVALCGAANAQVSGMEIGYCDGLVKTAGSNEFSCQGENNVSAAIFLPAATMQMYSGCEIKQVHAGLASTLNVDNLTVWVRTSLDGENLCEGQIDKTTSPKMAKGWNTVDLVTPYLVPEAAEGIYVGLTFHQPKTSVGLSVLDPTMIEPVPNGLFVKLGDEAAWEDRSTDGVLPVEALVFGEKLPKYNLVLKNLVLDQPYYVNDKGVLSGTVTVRNVASCTISGFELLCTVTPVNGVFTIPVEDQIAYKEEKTYSFSIEPGVLPGSDAELSVTVANLKEGEDQYPEDNSLMVGFGIVQHDYARNVLIEEFTTENCPNCPRVANIMHNFLEMEGVDERANVICHHSAYYTDWLTIPADRSYTWLFNMNGATYAPAVLVDRATRDYISNDRDYADQSPIHMPQSADDFYQVFQRRCQDQAFVCLNVAVDLDDEGAHVTVTGERSKEDFTVNPARIVVGLVEDNIKARSQASGGSDFVHQHVNRVYNSIWGEVLEWDGDEYTYKCDLNVDSNWKKEDLTIVAYIWDYDPEDVAKCEVSNSNRARYAEWTDNTAGVSIVDADNRAEVQYFTLDGIRLSAPQKGVNIVRNADGTTSKIVL